MNYKCKKCGYSQDFEMTDENIKIHFPEMTGLMPEDCPGCFHGLLKGICNHCGCPLNKKKICKDCKLDFKKVKKNKK